MIFERQRYIDALVSADGMRELVKVLASAMGSSANTQRISNTFRSAGGLNIGNSTIPSI